MSDKKIDDGKKRLKYLRRAMCMPLIPDDCFDRLEIERDQLADNAVSDYEIPKRRQKNVVKEESR